MRAYGIIAAALVVLLVLPMPAHSEGKFPIDCKKGDLEAAGRGKKSDPIPVEQRKQKTAQLDVNVTVPGGPLPVPLSIIVTAGRHQWL